MLLFVSSLAVFKAWTAQTVARKVCRMASSSMKAPPLRSAEQTLRTAQAQTSKEATPSMEAYIGVMTARQAEEHVTKATSFKLYHMVSQWFYYIPGNSRPKQRSNS